ncbi:hypothetical protein SUGI_0087140 [Cryptomeria japonica]|uniref:pectinesterase n=1 Tax=Cryptomeria japonica TaxID=3369 RepID=UPI002408BDCD|nr:pectinesterase [Cryptomeria japonica]GLJ08356.1 hypothetical protein SUGI_0087140 [Cryptomeria japonica]
MRFGSYSAKVVWVLSAAILTMCVAAWMGIAIFHNGSGGKLIDSSCKKTPYPEVCVSALQSYEGANSKNLAHITVKASLHRAQKAYSSTLKAASEFPELMAFEDCIGLFVDVVDHVNRSMAEVPGLDVNPSKAQIANAKTWISAALTDVETCLDGFRETTGTVMAKVEDHCQSLTRSLSNALYVFQLYFPDNDNVSGFSGSPLFNNPHPGSGFSGRPVLINPNPHPGSGFSFPPWMSRTDRRLLQVPALALHVNATVAQDGSGQYKTIGEALMHVPSHGSERYVIYVKAGVYEENVLLYKEKTNVMLLGDGRDRTIVASSKNVKDGYTTFASATFGASGKGFIARDMTFANFAGPRKNQAVALRVGADLSAFYRCNFIGFQNTLYVHSLRQFYRECNIYGTVDFILGNAAAIFQNCTIIVRAPMANQTNTITAQGRNDPNQNTGFSIQNCSIVASTDRVPVRSAYLGKPWKLFSRTVIIQSFLGDVIHPAGWLEWSEDYGLERVYYGEYMNSGPGSKVDGRVGWGGYRVIKRVEEVNIFSVDNFISGATWLPSSGIPFDHEL